MWFTIIIGRNRLSRTLRIWTISRAMQRPLYYTAGSSRPWRGCHSRIAAANRRAGTTSPKKTYTTENKNGDSSHTARRLAKPDLTIMPKNTIGETKQNVVQPCVLSHSSSRRPFCSRSSRRQIRKRAKETQLVNLIRSLRCPSAFPCNISPSCGAISIIIDNRPSYSLWLCPTYRGSRY